MDYVDIQAVESKLTDVTVTPIPMNKTTSGHALNYSNQQQQQHHFQAKANVVQQEQFQAQNLSTSAASAIVTPVTNLNQFPNNSNGNQLTKYAQLLMVLEEMNRDIRPTYSGSRSSAERLKRGIVHARILVRECLLETERSARQ
uniref:Putative cyclin-dependent kinase 2-associated protein n=1 Tax=Culex tarsalis TaxID=7177 RepID=A0A1Q3F5L2_CULTA